VIDTQTGATCGTGEQALGWPSAGVAATQYGITGPVNLVHDGATYTTLASGPTLPAGTWSFSAIATVVNGTGQADTLRCGLVNGAGGGVSGSATTIAGHAYATLTIPILVTTTSPDHFDLKCLHDTTLPAGVIQAIIGQVDVQSVATRF